jgi:hypothetical protein
MLHTFDENIVSDLHKDARGFRPGEYWWAEWNNSTDAERQSIWDSLCVELQEEIEREENAHKDAENVLRSRIQDLMDLGAESQTVAIRWLLEAECLDEYDYQYGADYCAFHFGLSYQNSFVELFEQVCREKCLQCAS